MGNKIALQQCYQCNKKVFSYKGGYKSVIVSYKYYCMGCDKARLPPNSDISHTDYNSHLPCQYILWQKFCNNTPTHAYGVYSSVFVCNKCRDSTFIVAKMANIL